MPTISRDHNDLTVKLLLICLVTGVLSIFIGCPDRGITIIYVVPDAFRGVIKLRGHQSNGVELNTEGGLLTTPTVLLKIPKSGILDIRGDIPTLTWHQAAARYESGQPIPVQDQYFGDKVANNTIALRTVSGGVLDDEDWLLVGTYEDLLKAETERHTYKYPK